jgi:hypothetical protein
LDLVANLRAALAQVWVAGGYSVVLMTPGRGTRCCSMRCCG